MIDILDNIQNQLASFTRILGYNEIHGKIIAALLIEDGKLSLDQIKNKTKYSLSSISVSIEILEIIGVVKKFKNPGDRKIYVKLEGDILAFLRNAILIKLQNELKNTLDELEKSKKSGNVKINKIISNLEKEFKRIDLYIKELSSVKLPKTL